MKQELKTKYNHEVVKTLTKEQFIEQHPHVENAGDVYDKIVGKPEKAEKSK